MAVIVHIPGPLQKLTNNRTTVEIADADSVEDLIDRIEDVHPGIKNKLVQNGEIRRYINVFVNDDDIRFSKGKETTVKDGDSVIIVPAIAGGSE